MQKCIAFFGIPRYHLSGKPIWKQGGIMDGSMLKVLREKAGISREELARLFDVSIRTLSSWESSSRKHRLGKPYITASHSIFARRLFQPILKEIASKASTIAPSEFVGVWMVCGMQVVLYADVALHTISPSGRQEFFNDEISKPLGEKSMTVAPLQAGEIINLSGDDINKHPEKRLKNRHSHYFADGICQSLLHIPLIIRTSLGPRPVALLALENRGSINRDAGGTFTVRKPVSGTHGEQFYSPDEVAKLKSLFGDAFDSELKDIYEALDCFVQVY